jgi:hypothetical protein
VSFFVLTPTEQADALGLSLDTLAHLALCRMPRPGETAAVERIAGRVAMAPARLAALPDITGTTRPAW